MRFLLLTSKTKGIFLLHPVLQNTVKLKKLNLLLPVFFYFVRNTHDICVRYIM